MQLGLLSASRKNSLDRSIEYLSLSVGISLKGNAFVQLLNSRKLKQLEQERVEVTGGNPSHARKRHSDSGAHFEMRAYMFSKAYSPLNRSELRVGERVCKNSCGLCDRHCYPTRVLMFKRKNIAVPGKNTPTR